MPVTAAIAATTTAIPSHAIQFMISLLQDTSQLRGVLSLARERPMSLDHQLGLPSANCSSELPAEPSSRVHELSSELGVRTSRPNRDVGDDRLGSGPSRSSSPRSRIRRREMAEDEGYRYRPVGRWYDLRSRATLVRSTWHRQERNQVQKANLRQIGVCLHNRVDEPFRTRIAGTAGARTSLCGMRNEQ